jgi:biotin synthase
MTIPELTDKIIREDYRITRENLDKELLLTADLEEMLNCAGKLQKHFCGNLVDFCSIINGRSGRCSEDCKYCAQAACNHTGIDEYGFLPKEKIIAAAKANQDAGVNRFAIVTAGRALKGRDFDKAIEAYKEMHAKLKIKLCASMGFIDAEQFRRLKEAGVTSYHHNIETSRRNFPNICTTHTFEDKIRTIKIAQKEGMHVCSGGIIGMGETWDDRIDMALTLAELDIRSIPLNVLMPIKGTPLQDMPQVSAEDAARTAAIFRFINPAAHIRLAGGRGVFPGSGATVMGRGVSACITGNMLTTAGAATISTDMQMLKDLGLTNNPEEAAMHVKP